MCYTMFALDAQRKLFYFINEMEAKKLFPATVGPIKNPVYYKYPQPVDTASTLFSVQQQHSKSYIALTHDGHWHCHEVIFFIQSRSE